MCGDTDIEAKIVQLLSNGGALPKDRIRQSCSNRLVCSIISSSCFALHGSILKRQGLVLGKYLIKLWIKSEIYSCRIHDDLLDSLLFIPVMKGTDTWICDWWKIHNAYQRRVPINVVDIIMPHRAHT